MKAPFPWFGGKARAASLIWDRFGDVDNYVEPFAGSLAVLLDRPHWPFAATRVETVNDVDAYVVNFWRAIQADPNAVAGYADAPVMEVELHARHAWLHRQAEHVERLKCDPDYYDARIAGYWCWGLSSWIGDNFCRITSQAAMPHLGDPGKGVNRQLPHLGNPGMGVNRKLPHLGDPGKDSSTGNYPTLATPAWPLGGCVDRRARILAYFLQIADRLRGVRVCCGDWLRVLGPSPTHRLGLTGVLLDPPYDVDGTDYGQGRTNISSAVREWAITNGDNPLLRIALCGYADEGHAETMPPSWECAAWKAGGGYNNLSDGKNRRRERIWFSPSCIQQQGELFQ